MILARTLKKQLNLNIAHRVNMVCQKIKTMNANELNLKAAGKARRDEEIRLHGKQIFFTLSREEKSKKTYTRKLKHKKNFPNCNQ